MPNFIPFLVLVIISAAILIQTGAHNRQIGIAALFLCFSGMVYTAEFFVLIIWDGYRYFPHVLKNSYYDNALGAVASNLFIIPSLATAAAVYQIKIRWLILIAAALIGVEFLFEWLGVYQRYWWRKEYTFIVLVTFFLLAKFWMRALQAGRSPVRFLSLWMLVWASAGTIMYILSVLNVRHYLSGLYADAGRDDLFVSTVTGMIKGLIFASVLTWTRKIHWHLLVPPLILGVDLPLYGFGILHIEIAFWKYALIYLLFAFLLLWLARYAHAYFNKLNRTAA
ncbi:hypothetical protein [Paenibacillus pinistramenti]|uniref:hypothetical protein n=1 Tax=Paenibacillus pinistramenti TaxID=1768003 RepID=UPI001108060A|nr:hypothetical protein [Paenibacillus pinistramenti]